MVKSLVHYRSRVRDAIVKVRGDFYRKFWGMDIGKDVLLSLSAKLDKTYPRGVHIGDHSHMTFRSTILTHDFINRSHTDTYIGRYCFIGCGVIIMPGVRIGDHCIIGAGSVVTRDVPANSIAAGNPARVIKSGIMTGRHGSILKEDK